MAARNPKRFPDNVFRMVAGHRCPPHTELRIRGAVNQGETMSVRFTGWAWWAGWIAGACLAVAAALVPRPGAAVCNFTTNKIQILNGTTLTYQIIIQNNTGSGFGSILLTDTVPAVLTNQTSDAPA